MTYDWNKHRIGLVLTGGGAKGAYQIGCWKAMQEEGITEFEAISGTSIGGINAFLFGQGDLERAAKLWATMGKKSPLPKSLIQIVLALMERFGLAAFFAAHLYILLPIVALLSMVVGLVAPLLLIYLVFPESLIPLRLLVFPFLLCCFLGIERMFARTRIGRFTRPNTPYSRLDLKRYLRQSSFLEFSVLSGFLLGFILPAGLLVYDLFHGFSPIWALLLFPCFFLSLLVVILNYEFGVSSPGQLPLISGDRLYVLLKDHVREHGLLPKKPRVYVSRLREESVYLPGRVPDWVNEEIRRIMESENWSMADIPTIRRLMEEKGLTQYCAFAADTALGMEYLRLNDQPEDKVVEFLSSTGAIAGFLPRVRDQLSEYEELDWIQGSMKAVFCDAGLVDNTPIAPLLEREECDLIIVIFLDHRITDARAFLETKLETINDRIRRMNHHLDDELYEKLKDIRFLRPVRVKTSRLKDTVILPIVPRENLGGFFNATLIFTEEKINDHIEKGRRDTKLALKQFVQSALGADG